MGGAMEPLSPSDQQLAETALRYGFLTESQLGECRDEAARRGLGLVEIMVERDHLCASDVTTLRALACLKEERTRLDPDAPGPDVLSIRIIERGFATSEQVEHWVDEWSALPGEKPGFSQFLLHRGLLSTSQIDQLDAPLSTSGVQIGSRFGRYRIEEVLGEGSAGYVFRALDLDLQRPVAIKVLKQTESMLPQHLQRFLREAKIMASLRHPNIVPVYEVGAHDGRYYFAMELVRGVSLERAFSERRLGMREVAETIATLARALHVAHSSGIVHRDLKPSNVLMDGPSPKIMDFGLARVDSEDLRLTQTGTILGSPVYMSPEQVDGRTRADARSDVYSLGVMLYEGTTGQVPYRAEQISLLFNQILEGDAPRPRRLAPDMPADLENVILKAISRDPARRYATADDLAQDLQRAIEGKPVRAEGLGPMDGILRRMRKNRNVLLAAGAAAALTLAAFWAFETFQSADQAGRRSERDLARAAIERFEQAVLSRPEDVRAALPDLERCLASEEFRPRALFRLGRWKEAEPAFAGGPDRERILNLFLLHLPKLPPVSGSAETGGSVDSALRSALSGNLDEAIVTLKTLEASLEGRPQAECRKAFAILLAAAGRVRDSVDSAGAAMSVLRADPDLLWLAGEGNFRLGSSEENLRETNLEYLRQATAHLEAAFACGVRKESVLSTLVDSRTSWARLAAVNTPFDEPFYRRSQELRKLLPDGPQAWKCEAYLETWKFAAGIRAGSEDRESFARLKPLFARAQKADPTDPWLFAGPALANLFAMSFQTSHGEFDPALYDELMEQTRSALKIRPDHTVSWAIQLDADTKRMQHLLWKEALTDLDFVEARERAERAPAALKEKTAWLVGMSSLYACALNSGVNRGLFRVDLYEAGVDLCERAIRSNPKMVTGYINLGAMRSLRASSLASGGAATDEDFAEALEPFERALELEPDQPVALLGMANMYASHYRELIRRGIPSDLIFQNADERYQKVLKGLPKSVPTHYNCARLHVNRVEHLVGENKTAPEKLGGILEAAQRQCDALVHLNPVLVMGQDLMGQFLLLKCRALAAQNNLDLKDLERALRVNESLESLGRPAPLRVGELYELSGDSARALGVYRAALSKAVLPQDRAVFHSAAGRALLQMGRSADALRELEDAVRLDESMAATLKPLIDRARRGPD
jgi:tetratricopeptide (TPR) repeat protein